MSTKVRAWMVGAAAGTAVTAYVNYQIIKPNQSDMLLKLRQALLTPEIRRKHDEMDAVSQNPSHFPLFSKKTLNLVLISISDKFLMTGSSSDRKLDDSRV
jgi:hypothetical protein